MALTKQDLKDIQEVIITTVTPMFEQVYERFDKIEATQAEHSRILKEHSNKLDEHSRILEEHSRILKEHTNKLDEHSRILGEHSATLKNHSVQLDRIEARVTSVEDQLETLENDVHAIYLIVAKLEKGKASKRSHKNLEAHLNALQDELHDLAQQLNITLQSTK